MAPQEKTMAKNAETVKVKLDGSSLTATVRWDAKGEYNRPVSKKTGKTYREVLAQVGNSFGSHYIGNGLYLRFELSRGEAPSAASSSAVEVG
jgi:hypothetical protein